jgi:phosphoenolpyruvate synthase/pyruvate phosphate dikinase
MPSRFAWGYFVNLGLFCFRQHDLETSTASFFFFGSRLILCSRRKASAFPMALLFATSVTGSRARVIVVHTDLLNIRAGEILMCDAIDPNMTFAVLLAAGMVERRGGMLMHGSIIAREYGIPCVTGVLKAVEIIKTGDRLIVDGSLSIVTIEKSSDL